MTRRIAPWTWNWRWRITDNEWRREIWERGAPIIVAVFGLIVAVCLPVMVVQQYDANRSQDNHHAQTVKSDQQLASLESEVLAKDTAIRTAQVQNKGTLTEISTLEKEVSSVILSLPGADAYLGAFASSITAAQNWVDSCIANKFIDCGVPPKVST